MKQERFIIERNKLAIFYILDRETGEKYLMQNYKQGLDVMLNLLNELQAQIDSLNEQIVHDTQ